MSILKVILAIILTAAPFILSAVVKKQGSNENPIKKSLIYGFQLTCKYFKYIRIFVEHAFYCHKEKQTQKKVSNKETLMVLLLLALSQTLITRTFCNENVPLCQNSWVMSNKAADETYGNNIIQAVVQKQWQQTSFSYKYCLWQFLPQNKSLDCLQSNKIALAEYLQELLTNIKNNVNHAYNILPICVPGITKIGQIKMPILWLNLTYSNSTPDNIITNGVRTYKTTRNFS